MLEYYELEQILNTIQKSVPIRINAYGINDRYINKEIEGMDVSMIHSQLDNLDMGPVNYNYVIKIGMG